MEALAFFLNEFKNGKLPEPLKEYLLAATVLSIAKSGSTKPRPVAVCELFYRIVTSWSVDSLSKAAANILLPIQLGVGVKGGIETACLSIQALDGGQY